MHEITGFCGPLQSGKSAARRRFVRRRPEFALVDVAPVARSVARIPVSRRCTRLKCIIRGRPITAASHSSEPALNLILARFILPAVLLHIAFSGCRVNLSLTALSLDASPLTVGVIASMMALLPMIFSVAAGRVIDRIGPRKPMLLGAGMVLTGLLLGFALPRIEMLFLVGVLSGAGFMLLHIAVSHATGLLGQPDDRMRNFSILALGFSTANVIGPTVAGFAIDLIGHRYTFLIFGASAAASLLVTVFFGVRVAPAPHADGHRGEKRIADFFRSADLRRVLIISTIMSMAWDMFTFLVPIYGTQIGLSASQIGLILGTFGAAIFSVRVALPLVARHLGQWHMLSIAMLATGVMLFVFPLFSSLPVLLVIAFLLGIGLGGTQPTIMSLLMAYAPEERGGEAVGLRTLLVNCSQAGIPLAFGALGAAFGVAPVFWIMGILLTGGGYRLHGARPAA